MNETDKRILKFWGQGCSLDRIAKKIGRPSDISRVVQGLKRAGISESVIFREDEGDSELVKEG